MGRVKCIFPEKLGILDDMRFFTVEASKIRSLLLKAMPKHELQRPKSSRCSAPFLTLVFRCLAVFVWSFFLVPLLKSLNLFQLRGSLIPDAAFWKINQTQESNGDVFRRNLQFLRVKPRLDCPIAKLVASNRLPISKSTSEKRRRHKRVGLISGLRWDICTIFGASKSIL